MAANYTEKWDVVYKSFQQINFSAFDYNTVKHSLVEHIKSHYPENFNNFIESDEFIMILESFSYISELFAYRLDMNAHENYIGTAGRKESVLRLAQLISYTPTRNLAARGLVKIETVSTTEDVFDSRGRNLSNTTITWNDPNNPYWKEQFILVMNRMMERDFGTVLPEQRYQVNDVLFEQYVLNNNPLADGVIRYNVDVNGTSYPMEVVSADLDAKGPFEKRPHRNSKMNIVYSYDSIGDSSDSTGFFFYTKQGTLHRLTRTYDGMEPFMTDEIDINNINDTDVWINNIDSDTGQVIKAEIRDNKNRMLGFIGEWESVDTANLYNLSFNTSGRRNKYQVETLERDRIRLVFGDGEFSDIPQGTFDVWVRSSQGSSELVIPKSAIDSEAVNISYMGRDFQNNTGTFTFSAINNISNSRASEDIEHIRRIAPLVYQTQDRMVSASDYNTLPLRDNSIIKLRTLNRTFVGHSKEKFNDPNGIYSDVNWFGEDLALFIQDSNTTKVADSDATREELLLNYIQPSLIDDGVQSFHRLNGLPLPQNTFSETEMDNIIDIIGGIEDNNGLGYPLGLYYMPENTPPVAYVNISPGVTNSEATNSENYNQTFLALTFKYRREGNNSELLQSTTITVQVTEINTYGNLVTALQSQINNTPLRNDLEVSLDSGNIRFAVKHRDGNSLFEFYLEDGAANEPPLFSTLESLVNGRTIQFDETIEETGPRPEWRGYTSDVFIPHSPTFTIERLEDGEWVIDVNESAVYAESPSTKFWFDGKERKTHSSSNQYGRDNITVLKNNLDNTASRVLGDDLILNLLSADIVRTGISLGLKNPNRVLVEVGNEETTVLEQMMGLKLFYDEETWKYNDIEDTNFKILTIDHPSLGLMVSAVDDIELYDSSGIQVPYIFTDSEGTQIDDGEPTRHLRVSQNAEVSHLTNSGYIYFNITDGGELALVNDTPNIKRRYYLNDNVTRLRGRNNLNYFWKHISTDRDLVDPAPTNIHDMYMITHGYFSEYVQWIGGDLQEAPIKPTSSELEMEYRDLVDVSMLSDTIIMRHGSIKVLFGAKAEQYLRGRFRVIKTEIPTLSDNEIVERIITITKEFFSHENWEMGETFYFPELASVIQSELVSDIKSIIVTPLSTRYGQGHLYQITPEVDEIFYPDITPSDIQFVESYTPRELGQE